MLKIFTQRGVLGGDCIQQIFSGFNITGSFRATQRIFPCDSAFNV